MGVEEGDPSIVRSQHSDAYVEYFNFKYGEIGSTTSLDGQSPEQHAPVAPHSPAGPQRPGPELDDPAILAPGKCCFGGCNGFCRSGPLSFCGKNPGRCEGICQGNWCPTTSLSQVKKHRQLRGSDHVFLQKLLRFASVGKKLHRLQKAVEL